MTIKKIKKKKGSYDAYGEFLGTGFRYQGHRVDRIHIADHFPQYIHQEGPSGNAFR